MAKKDQSEPESSKDNPANESTKQAGGEDDRKGILEIVGDTYAMNREQLTELVDRVNNTPANIPSSWYLLPQGPEYCWEFWVAEVP